jgi:hypothetical protein
MREIRDKKKKKKKEKFKRRTTPKSQKDMPMEPASLSGSSPPEGAGQGRFRPDGALAVACLGVAAG